ncbi:MAG: GNAT family N-acetyltransferase [Paracoccaceae bacterium]
MKRPSRRDRRAPEPSPAAFALRPAGEADRAFCRALYLASVEPLLRALGAWDAAQAEANFSAYFAPVEIRIVVRDGSPIGYVQVSETKDALHLDQIHLDEAYRGRGIGGALIRRTIEGAARRGKPLLLEMIRGNRALSLYERLGFAHAGGDRTKLRLRLVPGAAEGSSRPEPPDGRRR